MIKILCLTLFAVIMTACNTTTQDSQIPKRNNSASDYANLANEQRNRERAIPQHGNADRP